MRFWYLNMALLKSNKGTLRPPSLFFTIFFFRLLLRLKVFTSIAFKFRYDSAIEYSEVAF